MSYKPNTLSAIYAREWLNRDKGRAYIISDCEAQNDKQEGWVDCSLQIGDCNRSVTLEFFYTNEEERKAALEKAELFLGHVKNLRDFIANTPVPEKIPAEE